MAGSALVLGGGGVTGIAWQTGLLAGLAAQGVDLSGADLIVGTSAGSAVGVQVAAGVPLPELYRRQCEPAGTEIAAKMSRATLARYVWGWLVTRDPDRYAITIGKLARRVPRDMAGRRRAVIEARLPGSDWPDRPLLITMLDAVTGQRLAVDRDSGLPLVDVVAASCAVPGVWPVVPIDGREWMDGGVRSVANADLAAGAEQVVIVAPLTTGVPSGAPARQAAELRAAGARVALVAPDRQARAGIGGNLLDPAARPAAARAGYAQASRVAAAVREVWPG